MVRIRLGKLVILLMIGIVFGIMLIMFVYIVVILICLNWGKVFKNCVCNLVILVILGDGFRMCCVLNIDWVLVF